MSSKKEIAIFLFAHQDDESGVFYEINRLINEKKRVVIIYLTSGHHLGHPSPIRDNESAHVLSKMGISSDNVFFLGRNLSIPDGKLPEYLDTALEGVTNIIDKIGKPSVIYTLAWEGGHQDHDAAHLIAAAIGSLFDILPNCYQFPLYTGANLRSIFFKLFSPLLENGVIVRHRIAWRDRARFIAYCFLYPSQKKTWLGLFPFFLFHYIFFGTQILQPISIFRLQQAPHAGVLLYERRGFYQYQNFSKYADIFIRRSFVEKSVDK